MTVSEIEERARQKFVASVFRKLRLPTAKVNEPPLKWHVLCKEAEKQS